MLFPGVVEKIQLMTSGGFAGVVALLVIAVLTAFYFIRRNWLWARMIEDTPTARVRSAHQGFVELEGEGQLIKGPSIVGPLTNRPCLWYRYKIEKRESRTGTFGKNTTDWRTLNSGVSDALFELHDGTGRCVIDPDGAEVIPNVTDVWYGNSSQPQFATATGRNALSIATGRYRFTEELLLPGHIYVMGRFRTLSNAEPSLHHAVGALLRDWKGNQATLLSRFDRNSDREIDANEWQEVREAAEQEMLHERAACARGSVTHTLIKPDSDRHPFIISATPEAPLIRRYRHFSLMAFASMSLTAAGLLWVIAARLG